VGGFRAGAPEHHRVPQRFQVNFVLEDNVWRVRSYDPLGHGLQQ
jgi:hypothetical protein